MADGQLQVPGLHVVGPLGQGAQAIAYEVRRGGQSYVLKLPRFRDREVRGASFHGAFHREAAALARISSPFVPKVMEIGSIGETPYLVVELVRGKTLAERLLSAPLTADEGVRLGIELGEALAACHDRELIHRDVSASNVVFRDDGSACLIDFGYASDAPERDTQEAATGAPEEWISDVAIDLRALGSVLRRSCVSASGRFEEAVQRLLSNDAAARFESARAFVDFLRRGFPVLAHSIPDARRHGIAIRHRELRVLNDALRESSGRSGRVILLRGPAGSGKTRVLDQLAAHVASPTRLLRAKCQLGDPPLHGIRRVLEQVLFVDDDTEVSLERLEAVAGSLAPLLGLVSPRLRTVVPEALWLPKARSARELVVRGLSQILGRLLQGLGSSALLFDDVQWMDEDTHEVLRHVVGHCNVASFVFAARSDEAADQVVDSLREELDSHATVDVVLETVDDEEVATLAADFLGVDSVPSSVLEFLATVHDGTPLGVVEILRLLLVAGHLSPSWGSWSFDRFGASGMALPRSVAPVVARRVAALPGGIREVLGVAALIGPSFSDALLTEIGGQPLAVVRAALQEACRASLTTQDPSGGLHVFVHEEVRSALAATLAAADKRVLHDHIARALERTSTAVGDEAYAVAEHYILGTGDDRDAMVAAILRAARCALRAMSAGAVIRYLELAEKRMKQDGGGLDPETRGLWGEAYLLQGRLTEAEEHLREAIRSMDAGLVRSHLRGRMAWIAQIGLRQEESWESLDAALVELGEPALIRSKRAVFRVLFDWLTLPMARRARLTEEQRARGEALCLLYYQAARLGVEFGKPAMLLQATLRGLKIARRLGPSSGLVRMTLSYAFVCAVLGRRRVARLHAEDGRAIAVAGGNPVDHAYSLQVSSAILSVLGDFPAALSLGGECLLSCGAWVELREYCRLARNQEMLESLRGKAREALRWTELWLSRVQRYGAHGAIDVELSFVRPVLACVGAAEPPYLTELLRAAPSVPRESGLHLWLYAARVREFTERANVGDDFERLVAEFESLRLSPRRVHPVLGEYFLHVAYARVHQLLHATVSVPLEAIAKLDRAVEDLRSAARVSVLHAHLAVLGGYQALFRGQYSKAGRVFTKAAAMADRLDVPWVSYSVERGRAHMLMRQGAKAAARSHALIAWSLATEQGATQRARWVASEFGLSQTPLVTHRGSDYPALLEHQRLRRYVRALLRVSKASVRALDPQQHVRVVLDELIRALGAERGFMFLGAGDHGRLEFRAGRDDRREDLPAPSSDEQARIERLAHLGRPELDPRVEAGPPSISAVVVAPLLRGDQVVGAVCLEGRGEAEKFGQSDAELLQALANQVPLVLELGETLRERVEQEAKLEREIGERRRIELALRESEERYRKLIDVAYDAIVIGDADTQRIIDANERACELIGCSKAEIVGRTLLDLHPEHQRERCAADLATTLQRGEGVYRGVHVRDVSGVPIPVEVVSRVIRVGGGRLVQSVFRDLRERERLEENLRQAQKLEAIGRLAGGIAHDFNNLLTVIQTSAESARARIDEERDPSPDLERIHTAADRGGGLTRQLLAFSRRQVVSARELDINGVVEGVVNLLERLIGPDITVQTRLPTGIDRVLADEGQLEQVVMNLAVNARDALAGGGRLSIETGNRRLSEGDVVEIPDLQPGNYVTLEVSDTGVGMDADTRSKIFEPFFTTKPEGTGLGLATVYGIVKQARGHIEVFSELGKGTTFQIYLPTAGSARQEPAKPPEPTRGTESILYVEDDPDVQVSIRQVLQTLGYRVTVASSGAEALEFARGRMRSVDLLITDVMMPGMSGIELSQRMKELNPGLCVLYVSGYTAGALLDQGADQHQTSFLQKPFSSRTLARRVREMLGAPSASN